MCLKGEGERDGERERERGGRVETLCRTIIGREVGRERVWGS